MRSSIRIARRSLLGFWAAVWTCALCGFGARADSQTGTTGVSTLVMITAKSLGVSDISTGLLRHVYGGNHALLGGRRLIPLNYAPESALRRRFDRVVLELEPAEIGRYWIDRRIRGQGPAPRTLPNPEVAKAVVTRLPGAICYIPVEQLDGTVAALSVDGKPFNDSGYLLSSKHQP